MPLFLVNARLSERSLRGYRRFAALTQPMFASLAGVAAQTGGDAARLRAAGARDVAVTGNLKFDVEIADSSARRSDASCAQRFGAARPVWLAASTRDGEEALILDALARGSAAGANAHGDRAAPSAALRRGRRTCSRRAGSRSSAAAPTPTCPPTSTSCSAIRSASCPRYYAAADVAFVGGSLLPLGGQNLIEAIAVGTPTLVGPHTFNFAEATAQAVAAHAAVRVADADALVAEVARAAARPRAPRRACATRRSPFTPRIAARPTACGRGSRRLPARPKSGSMMQSRIAGRPRFVSRSAGD